MFVTHVSASKPASLLLVPSHSPAQCLGDNRKNVSGQQHVPHSLLLSRFTAGQMRLGIEVEGIIQCPPQLC